MRIWSSGPQAGLATAHVIRPDGRYQTDTNAQAGCDLQPGERVSHVFWETGHDIDEEL